MNCEDCAYGNLPGTAAICVTCDVFSNHKNKNCEDCSLYYENDPACCSGCELKKENFILSSKAERKASRIKKALESAGFKKLNVDEYIKDTKEENNLSCNEQVKNPSHYCDGRKYEPKDVIRDWDLNFNLGSAVKYISRAGRKDDVVTELEKAREFLLFEIEAIKEERRAADNH